MVAGKSTAPALDVVLITVDCAQYITRGFTDRLKQGLFGLLRGSQNCCMTLLVFYLSCSAAFYVAISTDEERNCRVTN